MANHSMTISAKAGPGDRSRKNTADHATLSSNCSRKSCIGTAVSPTFRQTSQAAIAIATYKIVQTGPNSQLGGVQLGLLKLAYHGRSAGVVHNDPSHAAPKQTTIHKISLIDDRYTRALSKGQLANAPRGNDNAKTTAVAKKLVVTIFLNLTVIFLLLEFRSF